jgi:ATP-binding cassette subfamily B protein
MPKKPKLYEKIIPKYIPNCIVLFFFSIIAFLSGSVKKDVRARHLEENERFLSENGNRLFCCGELIENQKTWEGVAFGSHKKSNMSYSGCEIIATYNALKCLGEKDVKIPPLISYFEQKGAALKGGFGITPSAPASFFKKRGYEVKKVTTRKKAVIDSLGDEFHTFIVTFYWNHENIRDQLHTVCISKESDGFYIHNNYCKSKEGDFVRQGAYRTLSDAAFGAGEKTVPLVTVAIRRPSLDKYNY